MHDGGGAGLPTSVVVAEVAEGGPVAGDDDGAWTVLGHVPGGLAMLGEQIRRSGGGWGTLSTLA